MKKKKKNRNFPIGVLELCLFLFAVSKEKKRIILTTFHRFFKNISRLYFRIAKKIMRKKKQNYG